MVGHGFRRLGAARQAARAGRRRALGRVVLAEATFSLPGKLPPSAWRAHRERNPGGPLMQLGIHHVDTLASWLGPIGRPRAASPTWRTDADIDDVGDRDARVRVGALGVVTGSYVSPKHAGCASRAPRRSSSTARTSVWPDAQALDAVTTLTLGGELVAFDERDMLAEELAEFGRA